MSDFKVHISGSILSSAGISALGIYQNSLNLTQASAVFIIGTLTGLSPDFDSDTGKPLALLFQLISVIIPSIFFDKARRYGGSSPEFVITYFTISYLFISYIVLYFVKRLTIHRGIFHSIPFAVLCGGAAYFYFMNSGKNMAHFAGISAFSGCLIHLILDELESFSFKAGFIPAFKKSSGTALKLKANSAFSTLIVYCLIIIVFTKIYLINSNKNLNQLFDFLK